MGEGNPEPYTPGYPLPPSPQQRSPPRSLLCLVGRGHVPESVAQLRADQQPDSFSNILIVKAGALSCRGARRPGEEEQPLPQLLLRRGHPHGGSGSPCSLCRGWGDCSSACLPPLDGLQALPPWVPGSLWPPEAARPFEPRHCPSPARPFEPRHCPSPARPFEPRLCPSLGPGVPSRPLVGCERALPHLFLRQIKTDAAAASPPGPEGAVGLGSQTVEWQLPKLENPRHHLCTLLAAQMSRRGPGSHGSNSRPRPTGDPVVGPGSKLEAVEQQSWARPGGRGARCGSGVDPSCGRSCCGSGARRGVVAEPRGVFAWGSGRKKEG